MLDSKDEIALSEDEETRAVQEEARKAVAMAFEAIAEFDRNYATTTTTSASPISTATVATSPPLSEVSHVLCFGLTSNGSETKEDKSLDPSNKAVGDHKAAGSDHKATGSDHDQPKSLSKSMARSLSTALPN